MSVETKNSDLISIGRAVECLKSDFPSLSISKVRYLEDEGLLKLARTKGGYRLFSQEDISRLAEILRLQSEEFLPLAVIKERMFAWQPENTTDDGLRKGEDAGEPNNQQPISLGSILGASGIGTDVVRALENYGLVDTIDFEKGLGVSGEDVRILTIFSKLAKFGIEPRHLRMYKNLAQREALLFQQILTPRIKHKSRELRQKSLSDLKDLVGLAEKLKRSLLNKSLKEANLI